MGFWNANMTVPSETATDPLLHQDLYTDLLTFTFCGPTPYNQNQPLFIDAEDPSRSFTATQFRQLVRTLIAGLKAHNVRQGDCVLLHLGNSSGLVRFGECVDIPSAPYANLVRLDILQILYPALFFGIIGAGGVYMGSNPRSAPQELDHIVGLAEPKLILTTRDALPTVQKVAQARGMHPSQICLVDERAVDHCAQLFLWYELGYAAGTEFLTSEGGQQTGHANFAHMLCYGESDWQVFTDADTAKNTPAAMFSTSGTGGLPKAAVLSHHAIVSHHRAIQYDVPFPVSRLMSLPMFHLFGALWTHLFPVRYGHPLFVLPRFEMTQFLATVHRYQISETYLVPAIIHSINQSSLPVSEYLSSLRYVGVAGAPIDGASMTHFRSRLHPLAYACQIWGMTEVGVIFQCRYGQRGDAGSIGTKLRGYEARLIDHEGNTVRGDDRAGELYVRGPGLLMEYKGRTDAKEANGWFRTGDVAYVKNGFYFIVGRTKELIKVRGYVYAFVWPIFSFMGILFIPLLSQLDYFFDPFLVTQPLKDLHTLTHFLHRWQVAPAEIEAVLLQHPGIADAAVTGVNLRDGSTEVPRAFIVRSRDRTTANRLTAEEVYKFARSQLASYKALDGGIIFVEEIPRTASGKIQRFKLAQMNSYREMVASLLSRFEGETSSSTGRRRPPSDVPVVTPEARVSV
ncbi:Nicotinic acid-CoA ligase pyr1 [Penicillium macrosclerotiorum]|uniref:Nicotinic acid-CoA ligase pyr1 n=1 Tax=Penicillium macrosclerotiorum TaxID=303699 RepID=UPI002547BDDA|nr:Nicotinic acid-CoA ligase pyr1 [Penicillium macrosclerotiorum]KAJ5690179.1 Nicotinic acid-CoA ligase pyr1 [Penicillium macrosclerotiorum]